MKGRPRKSTEEKKRDGTYRAYRDQPKTGPYFGTVPIEPHENIKDFPHAVEVWNKTAPALIERKIIDSVNAGQFAAYCHEMGKYNRHQEYLHENGETFINSKKEEVKRPQVKMANDALDMANKMARQFFITPTDRQRMPEQSAPQQRNELDDLLKAS